MANFERFNDLVRQRREAREAANAARLTADQAIAQEDALLDAEEASRDAKLAAARQDRIEAFLGACSGMAKILKPKAVPNLQLYLKRPLLPKIEFAEGWQLGGVQHSPATAAASIPQISDLGKSASYTNYPATPAHTQGLILDWGGIPKYFSGEPGPQPKPCRMADGTVQTRITLRHPQLEMVSDTNTFAPELLMLDLADLALAYNVSLPTTYDPRHLA